MSCDPRLESSLPMKRSVLIPRDCAWWADQEINPYVFSPADCYSFTSRAAQCRPADLILVDGVSQAHNELERQLGEIRGVARMTPILVLAEQRLEWATWIPRLLQLGATDIIDVNADTDRVALLSRFQAVHAAPFKRLLERRAPPMSARARLLIRAVAEVTVDGGGARAMAQWLGCRERTLATWCISAGLPLPRRLLAWQRLLLTLAMLDQSKRTVDSAAASVGYATYSFRRAWGRLVGGGTSLREGALGTALMAFREELMDSAARAATGYVVCR
jgi:AraC-like DNA-binding protein